MTPSSRICSKSGVVVLISTMLLSPIHCPPFVIPVIPPLLVHHPTPAPSLFVFPTVPCPQWTPCCLLALVSIVHCHPQLCCCQHHCLPLWAVAHRQGGIVVVVVIVVLSSRNRIHCHPASRGLQQQCGVHHRCQLQSSWSRNRCHFHFHPMSSSSQWWHRAWVGYH